MIKEVKVLQHQKTFIESTAFSTGLVAGYGAGKTYAGVLKTIIKKMQYPKTKVAYYLPTYTHIRDIAFDKFPEILNDLGLHYQLNRSDKELKLLNYGSIIFRNMSEPEAIIGYEVGYSLIDECDILPMIKMDSAFKHILARNRAKLPNNDINRVDVVGTPEGYKWFYYRFNKESKTRRYALIRAKTQDNPYLPKDYIDNLKDDYDHKLLEQYLNGEFVNINGNAVYHAFNRDTHVIENRKINTNYPLIISFDFNINPYNAVYLIQLIDGITYVIDNGIKKNAPLVDTLIYIKTKFSYLGDYLFTAKIYGDATGKSRSQGTARTNYDFIREAGFTNFNIKTSNPRVQDRVNIFNSMLLNGNNKTKLYVCERNSELIADLEQMSYNHRGIIDKSDLALSHASDSVGYYLEYENKLHKTREIRATYAQ